MVNVIKYIERKLFVWKTNGLITDEQLIRITDFEKSRNGNAAPYTLIVLGAVVISIGIISLIAYNWNDISSYVKLTTAYFFLSGMAFFIVKYYKNKNLKYNVLSVIYFIMIPAVIGLIVQIYNVNCELYEATALWVIVTLPLVFIVNSKVIFNLFLINLIYSLWGYAEKYFKINSAVFPELAVPMMMITLLPPMFLLFSLLLRQQKRKNLRRFSSILFGWAICVFLSGSIFLSFVTDHAEINAYYNYHAVFLGLSIILFSAVMSFLFREQKRLSIMAVITALLYYAMITSHLYFLYNKILDAAFFVLIWTFTAFIFYRMKFVRIYDMMIIGVGIRFLVIYFQVFGNLAYTGFGLIFSGIVIIGLSVLYIKKRSVLNKYLDRIIC